MLTFAAAVLFLIGTPGPGVLSTAGVGSGFGFRAGLRYLVGLFIGTNLVLLAVITGLAAVVLAVPSLRYLLMGASLAYLVYLAGKIAFAGSRIAFITADRAPGIGSGILLQLINPKAYAVNTTLMANFVYAPGNLAWETASKLVIMNLIWVPIHFAWLWAGASLNRLNLSDRAQRRINAVMAAAMLAVVILALLATLTGDTP